MATKPLYPHADLLLAWLDDKALQFLEGDEWFDIESAKSARKVPHLYRDREYRLKPLAIRWRVYAINGSVGVIQTLEQERSLPPGVKWLNDWQEVTL
jgi:hypothetical protein